MFGNLLKLTTDLNCHELEPRVCFVQNLSSHEGIVNLLGFAVKFCTHKTKRKDAVWNISWNVKTLLDVEGPLETARSRDGVRNTEMVAGTKW